jgi:hypothetical protein
MNRKKREKRESIIQVRGDGKRSAHIQARYNEATIAAHADILDMLHDLIDIQDKTQQEVIDAALQALFTQLTNGEIVGGKLENSLVLGELVTLVRQASDIQAHALAMLDKIEKGTFVVGDISTARNEIASKSDALNKASETLGIRPLPNAGQYAGEISFSDDED